jgi:hypothetical protein
VETARAEKDAASRAISAAAGAGCSERPRADSEPGLLPGWWRGEPSGIGCPVYPGAWTG